MKPFKSKLTRFLISIILINLSISNLYGQSATVLINQTRTFGTSITKLPNIAKGISSSPALRTLARRTGAGAVIGAIEGAVKGGYEIWKYKVPWKVPKVGSRYNYNLPSQRHDYVKAKKNLFNRNKIIEEIGEQGMQAHAEQMRWKNILKPSQKNINQGFDAVYRDGKKIIVVEAKGGSSRLGVGYGYKQGTKEWALAVAENTIKNPRASAKEVEAALAVINAKKFDVVTLNTGHILGKPLETTVLKIDKFRTQSKFHKGFQKIYQQSKPFMRNFSRKMIGAGDFHSPPIVYDPKFPQTTTKTSPTVKSKIKKITITPKHAGSLLTAAFVGYESFRLVDRFGGWSKAKQNPEFHIESVGLAGGWAVGLAGGALGFWAGGGTFSLVTTPIGFLGGYIAGEWLFEYSAREIYKIRYPDKYYQFIYNEIDNAVKGIKTNIDTVTLFNL